MFTFAVYDTTKNRAELDEALFGKNWPTSVQATNELPS